MAGGDKFIWEDDVCRQSAPYGTVLLLARNMGEDMGWRGTLRAIEASSRRAARDAERRDKARRKAAELEDAENTVAAYQEYLTRITTLHVANPTVIDWHNHAAAPEPQKPQKTSKHEDNARGKLEGYAPNIFDRLFKLEDRRRKRLQSAIAEAAEQDAKDFLDVSAAYKKIYSEWMSKRDAAEKILSGDASSLLNVIRTEKLFEKISDIGTTIEIRVTDNRGLYFDLNVMGKEVIPDEKYSLLQSGRLSARAMPKSEFFELYQDYVCSCLLRVAAEAFAATPVKAVVVTAVDELINPKNGLLENQALVSAFIPRETLGKLNLANIDPSDAMGNFLHNASFKKTKGFEPTDIIEHPSPCF